MAVNSVDILYMNIIYFSYLYVYKFRGGPPYSCQVCPGLHIPDPKLYSSSNSKSIPELQSSQTKKIKKK